MSLNKRQKIIIVSILLSLGLISTQLVNFNLRFKFMLGLSLVAYLLSLWSLWAGLNESKGSLATLNKTKAVILMVLPTLYTLAVASFYFLLPIRWLTRIPVALFFGLSFYLLLLSQNVFNVAAIRTIPLYRAASTAAFLFTLITAFFLYSVVHAFNLLFIWNGVAVALISFPLILQVLWSIEMEDGVSAVNLMQSLCLSLILGELAMAFSFWPMATPMWSLGLSSAMYVLLGITTQFLRNKVNRRVVGEYVGLGALVLLVSFLTTSWVG